MTKSPINYNELKDFIHETYEHIAKRPAMFAGRVEAIESFIFALELILDHFGGADREGRYAAFRSSVQFGNEPLLASFERINQCRLGFIENADTHDILAPDVFQRAFEEHWANYLQSLNRGEESGTI